jgi:HK97 family phage portal protein
LRLGVNRLSIFGHIFKTRAAPSDSLSTSRPFFCGKSSAGTSVTEQSAMRTAAVYACVRVISEAIASLPLRLYRFENGLVPEPNNTLYDILHTSPNSEMTSFVFRETLMSHILLYGNGYAQILRDGLDRITALYPLLPNKIDVCRNPDNGQLFYTYWRDRDETRPQEKSGGVALRKEEVLHIPGLSFDGLVGYSPIALAKNAIGMAIATEDYGASFFANGANPGGVLEHPSTLRDATALRETWEALYKGAKNSHRIAVLEEGLTFHAIGIPPEQAQFLETRKFQLNEIARVFRVPPHMIGDLEKSTFSNIEQQSMEFVKYTLDPWVVRLEQSMNQTLLSPSERKKYVIKFNLDGLLRGDYSTRMNGYAIGRQNGWLSANDIRKLEDLNPISVEDGGDKYLVNGNMVDLKNAGAAYREAGM